MVFIFLHVFSIYVDNPVRVVLLFVTMKPPSKEALPVDANNHILARFISGESMKSLFYPFAEMDLIKRMYENSVPEEKYSSTRSL